MRKINSVRSFALPIGGFVGVLIAFVIAIQIFFSQFSSLNSILSDSSRTTDLLSTKLAALQEVDPQLLEQTDEAYIALPAFNPTAVVISQLKKIAEEKKVIFENINVQVSQNPLDPTINLAIVGFKATGATSDAIAFARELENYAPLVNIDRIKLESTIGPETEVTGTINSYWASFPETLPQISEPITSLSSAEVNILSRLSELVKPAFNDLEPSSNETSRENPFSID